MLVQEAMRELMVHVKETAKNHDLRKLIEVSLKWNSNFRYKVSLPHVLGYEIAVGPGFIIDSWDRCTCPIYKLANP